MRAPEVDTIVDPEQVETFSIIGCSVGDRDLYGINGFDWFYDVEKDITRVEARSGFLSRAFRDHPKVEDAELYVKLPAKDKDGTNLVMWITGTLKWFALTGHVSDYYRARQFRAEPNHTYVHYYDSSRMSPGFKYEGVVEGRLDVQIQSAKMESVRSDGRSA